MNLSGHYKARKNVDIPRYSLQRKRGLSPVSSGKTEFLTKDLTPHAESKGHKVVYISFWRASLSPLALILYSLEVTLKSKH